MEDIKDFRKAGSYKILVPQISDGSFKMISRELSSAECPCC